jgi:sporulation protein YlmC with PRC-barrel domain
VWVMASLDKSVGNRMDNFNARIKFTESELTDTTVVDSEGYIAGSIETLRIDPTEIFVQLYGVEKERREVIDIAALNERFSSTMPVKRNIPIFAEDAFESGYKPRRQALDIRAVVREQLNLEQSDQVTEEQIARYAISLGLAIPYPVQETETRIDRGAIPWALVDRVGSSDFGRCVILKEPYEAKRRGIEIKDSVPYRGKKELEDKMVIDSDAKPVGSAIDILIGITHGILVRKQSYKEEESIDLDLLMKSLIPSRFNNFEDFKKKVSKDLGKKTVGIAEISAWCKRYNMSLPSKRQTKVVSDFEFSVDWKDIGKIGDVIILSKTIEELAQNQGSQKNLELIMK